MFILLIILICSSSGLIFMLYLKKSQYVAIGCDYLCPMTDDELVTLEMERATYLLTEKEKNHGLILIYGINVAWFEPIAGEEGAWLLLTQRYCKGEIVFSECGDFRCTITQNRSRFIEADLLVYSAKHMFKPPAPKLSTQQVCIPSKLISPPHLVFLKKWMYHSMEAPVNDRMNLLFENTKRFNLKATTHPEADLVVPYGSILDLMKSNEKFIPVANRTKSAPILWAASNCGTYHNDRVGYIEVWTPLPTTATKKKKFIRS